MKLVSFGPVESEQPGVLLEGGILPLAPLWGRLGSPAPSMTAVIGMLPYLRGAIEDAAASASPLIDPATVRLGAPVPKPGKVIVCGVNYQSQVDELEASGGVPPRRPPVVLRPEVSGSADPVVLWNGVTQLDYEGELVAVIGARAHQVGVDEALDYVAGYMCGQDLISRTIMTADADLSPLYLQPTRAKGVDSFCPTGPWLVTADEVGDYRELEIRTWVDDEQRQHGYASEMLTDLPTMIAWLSDTMTLNPGDLIFTGTPSGLGSSFTPPRELTDGQVLRTAVTGLGEMVNPIVAQSRLDAARGAVR